MFRSIQVAGHPYIQLEESDPSSLSSLEPGSIVVLQVSDDAFWDLLSDPVLGLADIMPAARSAIVLLNLPETTIFPPKLTPGLVSAGVDDVVVGKPDLDRVLIAARRGAGRVDGNIAVRLRIMGAWVHIGLHRAIVTALRLPIESGVGEWACALKMPERTLQDRCLREWLAPTPRRLIQVCKALRLAAALQEKRPGEHIDAALGRAGVWRPQTGRELLKSLTGGLTAGQLRERIGLYSILERWYRLYWPQRATAHSTAAGDQDSM